MAKGNSAPTKASKQEKQVIEALSNLLADSYTLYLKTHNYHWNVSGPMFTTLHTLFETQYTELALAVDEIAERIRSIGAPAPGSYAQFSELTKLKEAIGVPPAIEMVEQLVHDQVLVTQSARKVVAAEPPRSVGQGGRPKSADAQRGKAERRPECPSASG